MGNFNSKPVRSLSPSDDEQPDCRSNKEKKPPTGGKPHNGKSNLQTSKAVEAGYAVSGSRPKSIEDRTGNGGSTSHVHHSYPSSRRFTANFHRHRSSACYVPHSSRQAPEDYFSPKHHTGDGVSWSDKAYDRIVPEEKKDKK